VWIPLFERRSDAAQICMRLSECDPRLQSADDFKVMTSAITKLCSIYYQGHPQIVLFGELEPRWHDSNDCVAFAAQSNGLTDQRWVRTVASMPETIAHENYLVAARLVLFCGEGPTSARLNAEN